MLGRFVVVSSATVLAFVKWWLLVVVVGVILLLLLPPPNHPSIMFAKGPIGMNVTTVPGGKFSCCKTCMA